MKLWRLENFMQVVACGSILSAAEQLHISPQALHQQMDTLEKEVGCKLMNRSRKGISLTRAGNVFYQGITEVVTAYKDVLKQTSLADFEESNTIWVGGSGLSGDGLFFDALRAFTGKHPEIPVRFKRDRTAYEFPYDVITNDILYRNEDYIPYASVKTNAYLILNHTHPLAGRTNVELKDIDPSQLMIPASPAFSSFSPALRAYVQNHQAEIQFCEDLSDLQSPEIMLLTHDKMSIQMCRMSRLSDGFAQIPIRDVEITYEMLARRDKLSCSSSLRMFLESLADYYRVHWKEMYQIAFGPEH